MIKHFYKALGLKNRKEILQYAKNINISVSQLDYYNNNNIFPSGSDLEKILDFQKISESYLKVSMGIIDQALLNQLRKNALQIESLLSPMPLRKNKEISPIFESELGSLYQDDCLNLLSNISNDSVDMIFADPPFNLDKEYPSNVDDNLEEHIYIEWSEQWMNECIRVLKPGGSFFLWNLPKWNIIFANYLNQFLTFKHWIATDIKYSLPIQGRLYPSHYSLLYFTKGSRANTFNPDRLPLQVCPKCFNDIKDYGGYKNKLNPAGISLTDVWLDISPIRHAKYKRRPGANELSIKLLDRVIELATNENDLILDPFGGSGTTYITAELKNRNWIGCEIGPVDIIIDRFKNKDQEYDLLNNCRDQVNQLFLQSTKNKRRKLGLWLPSE